MFYFQPLVASVMANGPSSVLLRTTTAVTVVRGGIKHNVISPSAWAIVNHRIHPSQTVAEVSFCKTNQVSAAFYKTPENVVLGVSYLIFQ